MILAHGRYYYPCFTHEEIEVERGKVTGHMRLWEERPFLESFSSSQIILVPFSAHTHTLTIKFTYSCAFMQSCLLLWFTLTFHTGHVYSDNHFYPSPSHTIIFTSPLQVTFILTHTDTYIYIVTFSYTNLHLPYTLLSYSHPTYTCMLSSHTLPVTLSLSHPHRW